MPLQLCVAIPRQPGAAKLRAPARDTLPTTICRSTHTARCFARKPEPSPFRPAAQGLSNVIEYS